ncbi:hypothetical protein HPULCUR_001493 [Helicostylum pulchrum]|uniref:Uncharacterized protein n=1 Tax=Helicostylum pulchrum TaxID=562976 RepID=A0ABP9XMW6_9FUNG
MYRSLFSMAQTQIPDTGTKSARESMAQIAIKATMIKEDELDDLLIISELEAVALFLCTNKYSNLVLDPENPSYDANFIICDASGGTVDLATFRLTRNRENGDPIICQIGNGTGDTCGSTYIDRVFKEYLLKFYRDIGLEVKDTDTSFDSVMDDFIYNIKQCIQDELRGNYDAIIPEESAAAISKGAFSYGLKPRLISRKFASQSIALEVRTPFEKLKGDRFDKKVYRRFDDEVYSKNGLEYFASQPDDLQGESLKLFHRTVTEEDDKENWRYVSRKHTKILEEIIKLPEVEEVNEGDPVHFNVGLKMDYIGATVTIECRNRFINRKIR